MKILKSANRFLSRVFSCAAIVMMALLTLLVIFQVFNRQFFHIQAPWTEEFARFSMVWVAMLGSAVAINTKEHISVNMVFQLWPGKPTEVVRLIGLLFSELLYFTLFVSSFLWVKGTASILSQATRVPLLYIYIVFPVCALVMMLRGLEDILECAFGLFTKKKVEEEG